VFIAVLLFLIVVLSAALLLFGRGDKKNRKEAGSLLQVAGGTREEVL